MLGFEVFIWRGLLFCGQRKGGLSSVLLGAWLRPLLSRAYYGNAFGAGTIAPEFAEAYGKKLFDVQSFWKMCKVYLGIILTSIQQR